jgi:type-F conjugative transfer system pilin assembly protein TrbC
MNKQTIYLFIALFTAPIMSQEEEKKVSPIDTDKTVISPLQEKYQKDYQNAVSHLLDTIKTKENPMVSRAETAYQNYETSSVAGAFFDTITKQQEAAGESTTRVLLLFISSSMPLRTVKAYVQQAEAINTRIMVVMRGTIDNSLNLLPTVEYLKAIKEYDGCGEQLCQRAVNTVIDPRLFEQYGITRVPALAYSGELSNFGYFDNHTLPPVQEHTVIVGEATLPFLVQTLAQEINDESLTALASTYVF